MTCLLKINKINLPLAIAFRRADVKKITIHKLPSPGGLRLVEPTPRRGGAGGGGSLKNAF